MNRRSLHESRIEHDEGRGVRRCPIFPEMRPILDEAFDIFVDKSEYVVTAPQYRAVANTSMGWKNSNLRIEMTRLLRRAGVSSWPRLCHSMRASRQTEVQREFPMHPGLFVAFQLTSVLPAEILAGYQGCPLQCDWRCGRYTDMETDRRCGNENR
jgi:hypothetical protein